jgi:hypothetical protein
MGTIEKSLALSRGSIFRPSKLPAISGSMDFRGSTVLFAANCSPVFLVVKGGQGINHLPPTIPATTTDPLAHRPMRINSLVPTFSAYCTEKGGTKLRSKCWPKGIHWGGSPSEKAVPTCLESGASGWNHFRP